MVQKSKEAVRRIDPRYNNLSVNAIRLLIVLNELEQKYASDKQDGKQWFYRSNDDLAADAKMSLHALQKARAELIKCGAIQTTYRHPVDVITGIQSGYKITCYRLI